MVARQSKMVIKNQNTELKYTHINLAVLVRHSLSQKTSYRDTELQIQVLTSKISKGGKEARLKEEGVGGRKEG